MRAKLIDHRGFEKVLQLPEGTPVFCLPKVNTTEVANSIEDFIVESQEFWLEGPFQKLKCGQTLGVYRES